MTRVLIVAGVLAFVAGWNYFVYRSSGRTLRNSLWSPLWLGFTLTAVALVYGIAGLAGYQLPRHNPFIDHPAVRVGHVVWPQVELAAVVALAAVVLWIKGLKDLRTRT